MPNLDESCRKDIQGNILRAYGFQFARYTLLRVVDPGRAKQLIRRCLDEGLVVSAATWNAEAKPDAALNVAVTYPGLVELGLPHSSLDSFPNDFREGMPARARKLGDIGKNDPVNWEFGSDSGLVHILVTVHARDEAARAAMVGRLQALVDSTGNGVEVIHRVDASALGNQREHFGHADGFGQPEIEGSGAPSYRGEGTPIANGDWAPLKAGEFILGYDSESGVPLAMPSPDELGRNGTFLVYRQLAQDVVAYRNFLKIEAERVYGGSTASDVNRLSAKLVGRWASGCPVMLSPDRDDPSLAQDWTRNNDFRYAGDASGKICPIDAHVRRMNPRDAAITGVTRLHRIIRRGLPYGPFLPEGAPEDGVARGVAFMAISASITQGFEFLQDIWGNSCEFAGRDAKEVDPFIGVRKPGARFDLRDKDDQPKRLALPTFVTLRGGGYFFVPSLTALRLISEASNHS